eukprot:jgi/Chrpa1/23670/Chrysochromulina_OHIO_Genome00007250-RA
MRVEVRQRTGVRAQRLAVGALQRLLKHSQIIPPTLRLPLEAALAGDGDEVGGVRLLDAAHHLVRLHADMHDFDVVSFIDHNSRLASVARRFAATGAQ